MNIIYIMQNMNIISIIYNLVASTIKLTSILRQLIQCCQVNINAAVVLVVFL